MGAGRGMERNGRLAARISCWGGGGGGGGRSPGKFARAWGRGGAAELARVCGGGGHSCREPEESGERRGWGGAGGGPSGSRDSPLLLPLPSLVPFPGSDGTPPATPGNPHGPRRQSAVCSFAGCLTSRAVLGCCRPLLRPRLLLLFGWPLDVRKLPTEALQAAPCPELFRLPSDPPSSHT